MNNITILNYIKIASLITKLLLSAIPCEVKTELLNTTDKQISYQRP
jgi:hypothetical protein